MTKDDLVHEIGALIVADPRIAAKEWSGIALVATMAEGRNSLHGYRYWDDDWEGARPDGWDVLDRLEDLRSAMAREGAAWLQCLVHVWKPRPRWQERVRGHAPPPRVAMQFEYVDPQRWRPVIAPGLDLRGYAMSLRPPIG